MEYALNEGEDPLWWRWSLPNPNPLTWRPLCKGLSLVGIETDTTLEVAGQSHPQSLPHGVGEGVSNSRFRNTSRSLPHGVVSWQSEGLLERLPGTTRNGSSVTLSGGSGRGVSRDPLRGVPWTPVSYTHLRAHET